MAPTCTNCSGNDFVWANELKTAGGMGGGGGLSLRPRGEVPLGARICRTCGHAELFLRDLALLHQPQSWKPGEFIPIPHKPKPPVAATHHAHSAPEGPTPPPPPEMTPSPDLPQTPQAPSPPSPPAPEPEPAMPAPLDSPAVEPSPGMDAAPPSEEPMAAADASPAKPKATRRRVAKPKA